MRGLMQDIPLTVEMLMRRAEALWPTKTVITAGPDGGSVTDYGGWARRTRKLASALDTLGISADGRVGTFAWNTARHLELYVAVPATGRVLHTLNIRLFADQLTYIVRHAQDEAIFVDRSLLGILWPLIDQLSTVRHVVVMDDGAGEIPDDPRILDYEELIAGEPESELGVVTDEYRAAAMCYTSGTTGHPKGVVYTHRSIVLHTMGVMMVDSLGVSESDIILPVVPMFHANAWGLCNAAVFAGSSLVLPGRDLSPAAIAGLIEAHRVTVAGGVPTIWMGVRPLLSTKDFSSLRTILCGGSAVPKALSESYREAIGVPMLQAWGMTETSPVATVSRIRSDRAGGTDDELAELRATGGLPAPAVDLRISDAATGEVAPWDGVSSGEIQVRGPWIAASYYRDERSGESFTADGWLRTGDIGVVSADGYVKLVDRTKDLVKSGGEWISSVELENELMAHPSIAEAAVIAVPHERWSERPLACVVLAEGATMTREDVLDYLRPRVARWWLPDDVVFIDEVPKTSVGKFSKKTLRDKFAGYQLPEGAS